jgi:hypothetical protein
MVGALERQRQIIEEVAGLYAWIEEQLGQNPNRSGQCSACGACCNFPAYDHRLYVTLPELMYLAHNIGTGLKPARQGRCPYQENGKCGVHAHRFSGCRIFCCGGDAAFQGELSEIVVGKLKSICERFEIPYRYMELSAALAAFSTDTCLSAEECSREDREAR